MEALNLSEDRTTAEFVAVSVFKRLSSEVSRDISSRSHAISHPDLILVSGDRVGYLVYSRANSFQQLPLKP